MSQQGSTSEEGDYKQCRLRERTKEISRQLQLLRETMERRIYVDSVLMSSLDDLDVELTLLARDIDRR